MGNLTERHKINEFALNSKNKNIRGPYRGINEFKKGKSKGKVKLSLCLTN
jgi:hypothetical protein